jgi:hypothetical protein
MLTLKFIRKDRVARLLVAVLAGTLFMPVGSFTVPQLLNQSQAVQIKTLAAPTVTAVTPATGGLNVTWTAPPSYPGSSTVTGYQVEYSVDGTTYFVASNAIASTTPSYTITGLNQGTDYFVRVAARNSVDHGAYGYFWSKLYSTSNPTRVSNRISYDSNFGLSGTGSQASNTLASANFSRVRYEFTMNSGSNRASVDFNRFTSNTTAAGASATITNLAIPDLVNTFAIKSNVTDMTVYSTVSTLNTTNVNGHLEIWPNDYGTTRNSSFSFGSDSTYDANDIINTSGGYGSFQVFNTSPATPNTIFAWNNHGGSATDLGINSNTVNCNNMLNADWTFCGSTPQQRTGFNLSILINVPVKVVGPTISYTPVEVKPSGSVSATPATSGGSISTFSVSASTPLPATLAINSATGVISGTAPSTTGSFTYTINAISGGSTALTTNFVLTVGWENSICFNGTNQYLSLTTNTNLPLGNDAYTIEAFVKSNTSNFGGIAAWGTYESASRSNAFAYGTPNSYRNYHWKDDLVATSRNNNNTNGSWHHVVAQFNGSTKRIYENGFLLGTNTTTLNVTGTNNFTIGRSYNSEYLNGCVSNLRIVKGVAVYGGTSTTSANFAVPTSFLTKTQSSSTNISAITGNQTVLLMNTQSNILLDASNFGYTLTSNGTPRISADGPSLTSSALTAQAALTLNSTSGTYGTPLRLTTTGGSGTGAVSYSTSTGGCNITNTDSLTVTSAVTCSVTATKAADANYTAISSSATNVVFATRPITIKAAAKSATYTGSSVSVSNSYSITSGTLAGSDTFTALTYTYSSGGYSASQTAPTIAGSYTITPSAASFSVGSASSYNITYETATLTINKANQGALTITTTTSKYGTPLRLITSGGSGTGALSFAITSSGTASGCSITNETITVSSIGTCKVTATKALDTNYLVTSSAEATITFAKAETITVTTTLSSNSVFYNELPANVTVTQTVTGLVNSDTPTVTNSYTLNSCQSGGSCVVGDIAPGGGYVFYVSATPINIVTGISTGGIYLATAPQTWSGAAADPTAGWGCNGTDISGTSEAVGSGAQNTWLNTIGCATAGRASRLAADSSAEGFTDWFMPSIGELNLIYNNLKLSNLSDLNGSSYWSSTQNASNPASSATYRVFNGSGAGTADKDSMFSVRPIRAFSPGAGASNTLPTDVGTYSVAPTLTLSSPASLNNYQAVEYFGTTLTINRARQRALSVGQYNAFPGISTYPLNVYGGSGPGLVTRSLIPGGSAGCSLAQDLFITATTVGTCDVRVEKAGTPNYFSESTTTTIYWIQWSDAYATRAPSTPTEIVMNHQTAITKYNYETLTVTSYQNSSGVTITSIATGATLRIIGDGFSPTSDYTEVVFASMDMVDLTSGLQVISSGGSNYLQLTVPSGVTTGAITVNSPKGMAVGPTLTITP